MTAQIQERELRRVPGELRLEIFHCILQNLGGVRNPSLIDLGAGHCKFSRIAHELGFRVTSLDARRERVPADIAWPFIQQDVRDADLAPYGIVLILGLLYHLPFEDQQRLLSKCRGKTVIVDTHCAQAPLVNCGGYWGRYFQEVNAATAAFANDRSFWMTEQSLRDFFRDMGFEAEKIEPEHAPLRAFWLLRPKS